MRFSSIVNELGRPELLAHSYQFFGGGIAVIEECVNPIRL